MCYSFAFALDFRLNYCGFEDFGQNINPCDQGLASGRERSYFQVADAANNANLDGFVTVQPADTGGTGLGDIFNQSSGSEYSVLHKYMVFGNLK